MVHILCVESEIPPHPFISLTKQFIKYLSEVKKRKIIHIRSPTSYFFCKFYFQFLLYVGSMQKAVLYMVLFSFQLLVSFQAWHVGQCSSLNPVGVQI